MHLLQPFFKNKHAWVVFTFQDLWKQQGDAVALEYWKQDLCAMRELQFVPTLPSTYFGIVFIQVNQLTATFLSNWRRNSFQNYHKWMTAAELSVMNLQTGMLGTAKNCLR